MVIKAQQPVLTVTVYRPPKHDSNFLSEFYDFMSIILTSHDKIILLGDINFHVNDHTDSRALDFLDLVACLNLVQHVQSATHMHGNTLDLVITRGVDISSIAKVPVSDHFCAFFNTTLSSSNDCQETVVVKRNINNKVIEQFSNLVNIFPPSTTGFS